MSRRAAETPDASGGRASPADGSARLAAGGALAGALLASSCCVLPLVLFLLGVTGAWIGSLTALAPWKPLFLTATAGLLGYGYYHVYFRRSSCARKGACARSASRRPVEIALWVATVLAVLAGAFDRIAPLLLD